MIRPISDAIRVQGSAQKRYVTSSKLSYASAGNEKNLLCAFLLEKLWSFSTPWGFSLIGIALKNPYFAPFLQVFSKEFFGTQNMSLIWENIMFKSR